MAKKNAEEDAEKPKIGHPDDFQVSGPRNLNRPTWRDIINSNWKDEKYKRTVIACFIQAVYLLELDRQEKREGEAALAPEWWKPFKYKVVETLVDKRDGSIFGATLEWDTSAALSDLLVIRPRKAPKAIIALRGTLLKTPTIRRDIEDDLRILTMENLRGSCRFRKALEAVKVAVSKHGSAKVCMAGHSLGAGLALQVGKALAEEGICVEAHLFNPPSLSLGMGLRSIGEKVEFLWNMVLKGAVDMARAILPSRDANSNDTIDEKRQEDRSKACEELRKWVPHLYVNNSDYICCYYNDIVSKENRKNCNDGDKDESLQQKKHINSEVNHLAAKLFVMSKGPRKFLEAHGLQQWWSSDSELQLALNNSKLIQRQLSSLYSAPPPPQLNP
eukprot:Gb_27526 [translate_table: standard]